MNTLVMIVIGVVLTLGTGVFVAAQFSFVALDSAAVERRAVEGDKRAASVREALRRLSTHLSGAQVGITLTTILLGYTTQVALTTTLTDLFGNWGVASALATVLGVVVALVVVNLFSMLFGELIPKNMALADPLYVAGVVAPLQKAFTWLFSPLIAFFTGTANRVVRALGVTPMEEISSARSASELAAMVRHSAEEGALDVNTATLFTRSVGMGELSAVDVMRSRGHMETLDSDATADDLIELAKTTGHSRFPVIGENSDDILGVAHLRRAIGVPFERRSQVPVTSSSLMTELPRVPETVSLAPLLIDLREQGSQMALVVDEYGGTAGLVTLEDVVEEIVGEIADEHDPRRRGLRMSGDGAWLVPGVWRPDEVQTHTGIFLPEDGPFETIAGLILFELKRMPQQGDTVTVNDCMLEVLQMDGHRIECVKVYPPGSDDEDRLPSKAGEA
ncbi:MAG: hemolysin family protein [Actinomycetaceae bacterium]|nr:hemolysin family protein [Actinomycetaceae bacterium]